MIVQYWGWRVLDEKYSAQGLGKCGKLIAAAHHLLKNLLWDGIAL
jgi:hypothetical protein